MLSQFVHFLSILEYSNVHGSHGRIGLRHENFLFEDDTVLGRSISVRVLDRLATDYLLKLKILLVGVEVDLHLSLRSIVRHAALYHQYIAFLRLR